MALVPNGQFRKQKGQVFQNRLLSYAQAQQANPAQKPTSDPRLEIEQEDIGGNEPAPASAAPQASSAPVPQEIPTAGEQPAAPSLRGDTGQKPESDGEEGGESDIKDSWKQVLTSIGVPPRTIDNLEKQLYSEETDLSSNTLKGHYMIPTYTTQGKISKQRAMGLARKMEQSFGLTSKMKLEGRNWRIDFSTRPKVELQHGGSSFDHLQPGAQQQKAAQTMGEMIKDRRDDLFNIMRKIAQGSK